MPFGLLQRRAGGCAQNDFDTFVAARIEQGCGAPGAFAVFGHGWRYELWPLDPYWPRASDSADLDVEIIGSSCAAQDGRYRYNFSQVRTTFDRQAVGAAGNGALFQALLNGEPTGGQAP